MGIRADSLENMVVGASESSLLTAVCTKTNKNQGHHQSVSHNLEIVEILRKRR